MLSAVDIFRGLIKACQKKCLYSFHFIGGSYANTPNPIF